MMAGLALRTHAAAQRARVELGALFDRAGSAARSIGKKPPVCPPVSEAPPEAVKFAKVFHN